LSGDGAAHASLGKAAWRLLPFIVLLYFVSFLDRVNIGFAALTMNADLGLSAAAYGTGAGIFFLGYFLFEIPSNVILERVGARRWISRILVTWGLLSISMAFVVGPVSFWIVRFFLGMAEAGFFPGIILYLTYWFPAPVRARITSRFLIALPLSSAVGAPVSTWLLGTQLFGFHGWQSMFLLEGLPAIILGIMVLRLLPDRPRNARWLTAAEAEAIEAALVAEPATSTTLRSGLTGARVWHLASIYFGIVVALYGFSFWAPQAIKGFGGLSNQQVGFLSAIPYLAVIPAMLIWAHHSDRSRERRWHIALPALLAGLAFGAGALVDAPALRLILFVIAAVGIYATLPVFWTLPSSFLGGTGAAGGIALINAVGNLGGYFGPSAIGLLKDRYGYGASFAVLAISLVVAGVLALALRRTGENTPEISHEGIGR
ncbi:MAG: major facilitator superfamily 1, partial [Alphaproteobacteria bacterium]|nr:major facilitator superfamily 1 [Alphaproteobacteria bacterium]